MQYSFDLYGWYSETLIEDRVTDVAPPPFGEKELGLLYPLFTGFGWVLFPYTGGEIPPPPSPIAPIPDPIVVSVLTPLQFLNRFTDAEAKAIIALSKTDPDVELWWLKYNKAQDINLDDPQTIAGVEVLELLGVIAEGRGAEILKKYTI